MSKKIIYIQILEYDDDKWNNGLKRVVDKPDELFIFQCDTTFVDCVINKIKRLFIFNNHGGKREGAGRKKKELKGDVSDTIY